MAKKNMNEKLKNLKEEKTGEATPKEQKIKVNEGAESPGTAVKVDEVITYGPEEAEEKRPKPVPKKNRRGSKQIQAELEAAKELAEGNKEKYTRLLTEFDNMRSRNERENAEISDKVGYKRYWENRLIKKWHNFLKENITRYDRYVNPWGYSYNKWMLKDGVKL